MKDMKNMTNQGGPKPGDNPKPDIRPPDEDPNPVREDPKPGEQPGNPNPDSFPNEIKATDADYRYKDGRQGVGEVPNPREVRDAADRSRDAADRDAAAGGETVHGDGQSRDKHLNGQTRNPE